jgi:bacterioferritin-associated ferredoxin
MIVCVCNYVTDEKLKACIKENEIKTLESLQQQVSICDQCKCCRNMIQDLITENVSDEDIHSIFA